MRRRVFNDAAAFFMDAGNCKHLLPIGKHQGNTAVAPLI